MQGGKRPQNKTVHNKGQKMHSQSEMKKMKGLMFQNSTEMRRSLAWKGKMEASAPCSLPLSLTCGYAGIIPGGMVQDPDAIALSNSSVVGRADRLDQSRWERPLLGMGWL